MMPEINKRRALGLVLLVLVILPHYSCSTVFTASISGSTIDKESWEEDEQEVGIGNVEVFLYNDEKDWIEDYTKWTEEGIRPDTVEEGEDPNFFLSTLSGADGAFTFSGIIWNRFFPTYGKSGDRVEVYFLFYNRDYGISKNPAPVYIVSDVTNQLSPFKLERITNPATVEGTIINLNTGEGVGAVNISIYVADSLDPAEYPEGPDYQTTSGPEGEYTQTFSFPKALGDSGKVKITVDRNGFNCDNYDGDGTPAGDYLETGLIEKETTYTAADIAIKQTEFSETLEGRISDDLSDENLYTNGVEITLSYTDPDSGDSVTRVTFSQNRPVGDTSVEKGYFIFTNLQWDDSDYTTDTSVVTATLSYSLAGAPLGTASPTSYVLKAYEQNYVAVEY
jgi:hypothetical protein